MSRAGVLLLWLLAACSSGPKAFTPADSVRARPLAEGIEARVVAWKTVTPEEGATDRSIWLGLRLVLTNQSKRPVRARALDQVLFHHEKPQLASFKKDEEAELKPGQKKTADFWYAFKDPKEIPDQFRLRIRIETTEGEKTVWFPFEWSELNSIAISPAGTLDRPSVDQPARVWN